MKRKIYTTPRTELFRVELEGTFASSATGTDVETGSIMTTGHEINDVEWSWETDSNGNTIDWGQE